MKSGHKVTMITGHYDIGGLDLSKGRKQVIDGINVIIVGTRYSNKQSIMRRIFSFICFVFFSIIAGLRVKNVDVIYASSTPLTIGIPAMKLKWFKRVPFIFEVRDQWPEIPIELGVIKNKIMIHMLLWLEKLVYKQSSAIVALSPGMAEGIRKVIRDKKQIEVVPNSCDTDFFKPEIDGSQIREKYGWNNKFVLLHFGAMGRVNNLEFVLQAAQKLRENKSIHFVLAGNGSQKKTLGEKIESFNLNNVEILDAIPKQELAGFVAACDVSLVTIANYKILERNSANKFFDSLSAGKPVLLNYSGWQRKILEDNKCGLGCDLCNLEQFLDKVQYLESHREEIEQMGQNARKVALGQFSRDKLAFSVLNVIEKQSKK